MKVECRSLTDRAAAFQGVTMCCSAKMTDFVNGVWCLWGLEMLVRLCWSELNFLILNEPFLTPAANVFCWCFFLLSSFMYVQKNGVRHYVSLLFFNRTSTILQSESWIWSHILKDVDLLHNFTECRRNVCLYFRFSFCKCNFNTSYITRTRGARHPRRSRPPSRRPGCHFPVFCVLFVSRLPQKS